MAAPTITLYRAHAKKSVPGNRPSWLTAGFLGVLDSPEGRQSARAEGRWFTDIREEADWYLADYPNGTGEIVSLVLDCVTAEGFRVSNLPEIPGGKGTAENPRAFSKRPDKEFFLPAEIAARAKLDRPTPNSEASTRAIPLTFRDYATENLQEIPPLVHP